MLNIVLKTNIKIKEYKAIYRAENKEKITEYSAKYRVENDDKIKENKYKITKCLVCNTEVTKGHKPRHDRSKPHLKNLENRNQ